MKTSKVKETKIEMIGRDKRSARNPILGCSGFVLLVVMGVSLLAFFFAGPLFLKEYFVKTEEAIAFSSQSSVSFLVMTFIILWVFPCMYWVHGSKRFLVFMLVPFIAFVLLFFNYDMVTYEGVHTNPYFQLTPKLIHWEEMEEVAFIPDYYVTKRETNFEIQIVYLYEGKSHWVETYNNLENLQKVKDLLAKQGEVPVFIYPLDKGDMSRLEDIRKDNEEYFEEILRFLEIKDIDNYKAEHILVNEAFYYDQEGYRLIR